MQSQRGAQLEELRRVIGSASQSLNLDEIWKAHNPPMAVTGMARNRFMTGWLDRFMMKEHVSVSSM